MGVKFFGQFLIELLEVDPPALRAALNLMEQENLTLGELAVRAGFATDAECRRVNGEQRRLDRPFGELAQEMGVINSIELEELLQNQLETRINIGDALVRNGELTRERLSELEDLFKRDQSDVPTGDVPLPGALADLRLARCIVDMFPRFCMRVARLAARLDAGQPIVPTEPEMILVASLAVVGTPSVEMHLISDLSFARKLSAGIASLPEESLTAELCLDGLGEFLNVVAGNAMSTLEADGLSYRLESPRYGHFPDEGWVFKIASEWGKASLILRVID